MKVKNLIKPIVFLLIAAIGISAITDYFASSVMPNESGWMTAIYDEPENSADAVYVGSSNCYAFWNQTVAYEKYGITVVPYTCSSAPLLATEYLIKEARKTQPNALYIININTILEDFGSVITHRLLDFMPLSKNKLEFTKYLCDIRNLSFKDRLEYYFPIIKYHSCYATGQVEDLEIYKDVKCANARPKYFKRVFDASKYYVLSDNKREISDMLTKSLESLFEYIKTENIDVLFITVPRAESEKQSEAIALLEKLNTINKLIEDNGFETLYLMDKYEDISLDLEHDYYNENHTNIHGSIKYTDYLSKYLIKNYGFKDKRGSKKYKSWDNATKKYDEVISGYVLDFELDIDSRDYSLERPKSYNCELKENTAYLSWKAVENADGYAVYKKINGEGWQNICYTEKTSLKEGKLQNGNEYSFAVVPYRVKNGKKLYGNYKYNGKTVSLIEED